MRTIFLLLSLITTGALAVTPYDFGTFKVHLTNQSIVTMPVDAIVNAANQKLFWPAGGVCAVIYKAADATQLNNWVKANVPYNANKNRIELGNALATPSFNLNTVGIKHIIHAVGPDARDEEPISAIYDAYKNSLLSADALKAKSIAFPAIGIGIFECDLHDTAVNAIQAILDTTPQTTIKDVHLTILDADYLAECTTILDKEFQKYLESRLTFFQKVVHLLKKFPAIFA